MPADPDLAEAVAEIALLRKQLDNVLAEIRRLNTPAPAPDLAAEARHILAEIDRLRERGTWGHALVSAVESRLREIAARPSPDEWEAPHRDGARPAIDAAARPAPEARTPAGREERLASQVREAYCREAEAVLAAAVPAAPAAIGRHRADPRDGRERRAAVGTVEQV